MVIVLFFFFFSSRRRHTRLQGDWSSDVCSSDLAAVRDPDVEARGGVEVLKRAGIETQIGPLAEEAAAQNAPFLFTRLQTDRPFVALKLATSIDGRIADAGGRSQWISGPEARDHVHWLRA